jgi:hypothetical protein
MCGRWKLGRGGGGLGDDDDDDDEDDDDEEEGADEAPHRLNLARMVLIKMPLLLLPPSVR